MISTILIEKYLHELVTKHKFSFVCGGEDGFSTSFSLDYDSMVCERFLEEINTLYSSLLEKLNSDITKIKDTANNNELLESLLPTLAELEGYSNDIAVINKSYREVYLNILKPIKDDNEQGIKATVKWLL